MQIPQAPDEFKDFVKTLDARALTALAGELKSYREDRQFFDIVIEEMTRRALRR